MPENYIQANTGGRLHPATEPSLSPLNRGFLYGDAIYEVWRTHHGVIFSWEEHWARLQRSATALHLALTFSSADIWREVVRTVAAFRAASGARDDVYIRLQVARGAGPIGLDPRLADRPEFVLLVQSYPQVAPEKLRDGLRLSVATGLRRNPIDALNPAWKTGNYLNNILCLREARARGFDEVLMLNSAGEVTEAAVSNIGFVRDGGVVTPPLTAGILGGITRALVLEKIAALAGVPARETTVRPEEFATMDESFLLSTTKDIAPVSEIDGQRFAVGEATVTRRLQAAFAAHVRREADAHPELRV